MPQRGRIHASGETVMELNGRKGRSEGNGHMIMILLAQIHSFEKMKERI